MATNPMEGMLALLPRFSRREFVPFKGPSLITGDIGDIRLLKMRYRALSLSTIAKTIDSHGPRREDIEAELARQSNR
jgi:hypothetical protein